MISTWPPTVARVFGEHGLGYRLRDHAGDCWPQGLRFGLSSQDTCSYINSVVNRRNL